MALFKIINDKVKKIQAIDLDLEKNLQKIFEDNLEEIMNVTFVKHEHSTSFGGRIDTLGIDKDGSPVIIEYKRSKDDNVINQGLSYLKWLLDHKDNFEKLCSEKNIDRKILWDSVRVICIAENFNKFDLDTVDVLPIKVELYKFRFYEEDILYFEPESSQKVIISTSELFKKRRSREVRQKALQKSYTLEDHLSKADSKIKEIFSALREEILSIDENIIEEPKAYYIAYKTSTNFADICLLKNSINLYLNVKSGKLQDSKGIARDLVNPKYIGHWGNGDYEVKITPATDLDGVIELIQQSYNYNK